jgi:hypothetical protein
MPEKGVDLADEKKAEKDLFFFGHLRFGFSGSHHSVLLKLFAISR